MDFVQVALGVAVGVFTCAAFVLTTGKWIIGSVVREVLAEMGESWVHVGHGQEIDRRLNRLEVQLDTLMSNFPRKDH